MQETVVVAPITVTVDRENLRAVFTVHESLGGDVELDAEDLKKRINAWLDGDGPLLLIGGELKLYEFKHETWRQREPLL